jgi:hypothetical protein
VAADAKERMRREKAGWRVQGPGFRKRAGSMINNQYSMINAQVGNEREQGDRIQDGRGARR